MVSIDYIYTYLEGRKNPPSIRTIGSLKVHTKVLVYAPVHGNRPPLERLQRLLSEGRHHLNAVLVHYQKTESLGERHLRGRGRNGSLGN